MVSLMLVLASVQADKCKQFICTSFDKGTTDICVKVDTAAAAQQKVRTCDTKKACGAIIWGTTDDATTDATCVAIPDPEPITNMIVPGDFCKDAKECFGDDAKKKCEGGVCTTTVKVGDDCSAGDRNDDWCPVGSYCDTANTKKCVAQKKAGETCASYEDCPTGLACHDGATAGTFVCGKWWTVEAGKEVDPTNVRAGGYGGFLGPSDLCKTRHSVAGTAPKISCRVAHVSADTTETALKRPDGPKAEDCTYTTQDGADPAAKTEVKDNSYCGFNKDDAAYCGKRMGDSEFVAVVKKVQGLAVDTISCHVNTGLITCGNASKVLTKDVYLQFSKALMSTVEAGGRWANYANNDNCVKSSITLGYWGVDSAFSSFSMTSLATLVLSISALFYMF